MIILQMANLLIGVSTVDWIVQYVWMILMHLSCSMARKSLSLIVIEDYFHRITRSGMTDGRFSKAKPLEKNHQSEVW
jgi:hypothetical protein